MGDLKRFFLGAFLWICGMLCVSPASADLGQTPWYDLPFAQVRMLSCIDGIQSQKIIIGGLQIHLKKGWSLQKPHLKSLKEEDLLWIDYPIRPNPQETTIYQNTLFIPMMGAPLLSPDFIFGTQGDLTACHEKSGCLTLPIHIQVPLSKEKPHYTPYCAFIMDELKQAPLPAGSKIKGLVQPVGDNQIKLQFIGTHKMTQAFLQNDFGIPFRVSERIFDKDTIEFRLQGKNLMQVKNWILITNKGVFRVPVVVEPFQKNTPSIPWMSFLTSGFLLFLCTPFFIFWGLVWPKQKNKYITQSAQIAQYGTLILIVFGVLLAYFPKELICFNPLEQKISLACLCLALIFPPKKMFVALLCFFLWPKPYLWDVVKSFQGNTSYLCAWVIGLICWLWLMFSLRIKGQPVWHKLFYQSLKKTPFATNFLFLMPTLFLCGWLVYQLNLPKISDETNGGVSTGLTIVCEGSSCLPWTTEKQIPVHFISESSFFGQAYLSTYHRLYGPMVLFKGENEITVFPESITPKKFHEFRSDWQHYHVLGKLANPLTRSGDAPHAPLPNAK